MENYYNFKTPKDILNKFQNTSFFKNSIMLGIIQNNWSNIIGEKMKDYCFPVEIKNNDLFVNCYHQGWINTLQFQKESILGNIEKITQNKTIKNIVFRFSVNVARK